MKKMRIGDLVFDKNLTEIRPVNMYFVSRYRQAARSGAQFPALIIEKGTKRIVSGNHRATMYLEEYGEDHEVDVIEKAFPDEKDVLREFAKENSKHGNALSGWSMKYITQKLLDLGDTPEDIASVLNIPVQKIKKMGDMFVVVTGDKKKKEHKPVKNGVSKKILGTEIKSSEWEVHKKNDRGISPVKIAEQIMRWIENDWIDWDDEKTLETFKSLLESIENKIRMRGTA